MSDTSPTLLPDASWRARLGPPTPLHLPPPDPAADLPAHVRAGSGLRRWNGHLAVIQDDVNALALVDERTGAVTSLLFPPSADGRRQFSEADGNKAFKRDLESCVVLPDGRLVALGSGSTAARCEFIIVNKDHSIQVVNGDSFFTNLRNRADFAGSELNIEGAAITGSRLLLFQRGNGAAAERPATNAVGALDLAAWIAWLDGQRPAPELLTVTPIVLGSIDGVPFGFTDATTLPDGRVVVLAGAEDSPDTYHDGDVLGARIGLLDGATLVLTDIEDASGVLTRFKLEGIDFISQSRDGTWEFAVVADLDDPTIPATLSTLRWGPPAA